MNSADAITAKPTADCRHDEPDSAKEHGPGNAHEASPRAHGSDYPPLTDGRMVPELADEPLGSKENISGSPEDTDSASRSVSSDPAIRHDGP